MPSYLTRSSAANVVRRDQAGDRRHDHVGQHPARLAELQKRLAHHVVDRIGRARIGEHEAQDARIDLVGKHHADLDQRDVKAEIQQRFVVGETCAAEMRPMAQLADHHPETRNKSDPDLDRGLSGDHHEKIDSGLEADGQHQRTARWC